MKEVMDICSKYKNIIFDKRPKNLAKDNTSTIEVVEDYLIVSIKSIKKIFFLSQLHQLGKLRPSSLH